jgi:hypothetical protein
VVAVSNFNEAKEKRERLELKGAPATPGVANLMHLLNKRYSLFSCVAFLFKTSAHL